MSIRREEKEHLQEHRSIPQDACTHALHWPGAETIRASSGGVRSVRYSVMSGWNEQPSGTASMIRSLYASACATAGPPCVR